MRKAHNNTTNTARFTSLALGKMLLIFGIALMVSVSASAQTDPAVDPDAEVVPIDGGLSVLVAAGVAYGAKQWRSARKTKQEDDSQIS